MEVENHLFGPFSTSMLVPGSVTDSHSGFVHVLVRKGGLFRRLLDSTSWTDQGLLTVFG